MHTQNMFIRLLFYPFGQLNNIFTPKSKFTKTIPHSYSASTVMVNMKQHRTATNKKRKNKIHFQADQHSAPPLHLCVDFPWS